MIDLPILYIEDDHDIREEMLEFLSYRYNNVHSASNGEDGLDLYSKVSPSVMIVDLKMPKMGGIELIKKIRENDKELFIIVTSAHSEKDDLLSSIHLSVNHYLIKPINTLNLIKIINDEHSQKSKTAKTNIIQLSHLHTYDLKTKMIYNDNSPLKMTKTESGILHLLVTHPNAHINYDRFEREVWKGIPMSKYGLRTHMMQLKKKLGDEVIIKNISGEGYMLVLERRLTPR